MSFKKCKIEIFFLIIFIGFVYFKIKFEISNEIFLGCLGLLVSLYFGLLKQKLEQDKLFKELFQSFNNRYDDELNDLLNDLSDKNKNRKIKKKEKNLIIDYLNLCSEEYLWYQKGCISEEVWQAWKAGILQNLKIKEVKKIYNKQMDNKRKKVSFYGLYEELKSERKPIKIYLNLIKCSALILLCSFLIILGVKYFTEITENFPIEIMEYLLYSFVLGVFLILLLILKKECKVLFFYKSSFCVKNKSLNKPKKDCKEE